LEIEKAAETERISETERIPKLVSSTVDDLDISIDSSDTMFILTRNNNIHKNNISNLVPKLFIPRETITISLNKVSMILGRVGIDRLYLFSIDNNLDNGVITTTLINNGSSIRYIAMNCKEFKKVLDGNSDFLKDNKDSLYIMRGGNFLDIKNIFSSIDNYPVCLGKGTSQKNHALSHLDFRLSFYLMAMFDFNYKYISFLNTFYDMDKSRYLSYCNKPYIVPANPLPIRYVSSKLIKYTKTNQLKDNL